MVKNIVLVLLLLLLAGCSREFSMLGWFVSEVSVDERFETSQRADQESKTRKVFEEDDYKVLIATDLHYSDKNVTFVPFLERTKREKYAFVTILGDFMYDKNGDLSLVKQMLNGYEDINFMPVVGNHEIIKGQWEKFLSAFGIGTYTIEVVMPHCKDLYVVLDGANATLGNKQMKWLENVLRKERKEYRYCFVLEHTNFFVPKNNVDFVSIFTSEEKAKLMRLFTENSVNALFSGHSHYHSDVVVNGVRYISIAALKQHIMNSESCLLTCSDEGFNIVFEPIPNK